jgi:hypothetical protein
MRMFALAVVLLLAAQDEKVTLKFNPKKGDKFTKTEKMELQLKSSVDAGGQTQELEIEQRATRKRALEFGEVAEGQVTRLIVDCAEDLEEKKEPPTMEWSRTDNAMHGRKVTISTKDGQLVREGAEGLKEDDPKKLDLKSSESSLFPTRPVAIGEEWEVKGEAAREFFGSDEGEIKEATIKMKVSSIKEIDKRRCAMLKGTLEAKGKGAEGAEFAAKMEVEAVAWIERGYVLSAKGKGKITVKAEGDQYTMSGDGPITFEMTNKLE